MGKVAGFELLIGGVRWTDDVSDLEFSNSGDEGGSQITFRTDKPMQHLMDAPVKLYLLQESSADVPDDFGALEESATEYFVGTLKRPMPEPPTFTSTAVALGPFAEMANQHFGEAVSYANYYLNRALYDIARRAYPISSNVEISGGTDVVITGETGEFAEEVTLLEAARALAAPSNFVQTDRGIKRIFMPKPKIETVTETPAAIFGPDDYPDGGFQVAPVYNQSYSKVVVFRRNEQGGYDVRHEVPIENRGEAQPPPNRIRYIPEFVGTAYQAQQAAYEEAVRISRGEVTFTLSDVPIDDSAFRYDSMRAWRIVERADGWWREDYDLSISESVSMTFADMQMSLQGTGILAEAEPVEDFGPVGETEALRYWRRSQGVLPA